MGHGYRRVFSYLCVKNIILCLDLWSLDFINSINLFSKCNTEDIVKVVFMWLPPFINQVLEYQWKDWLMAAFSQTLGLNTVGESVRQSYTHFIE